MTRRVTTVRQPLGPLQTAAGALLVAALTMGFLWFWMITI